MKAFPNGIITNVDGLIIGGQQGMDLRDWFAGLAMQGLAMESIAFQGLGVKKGVEYAYEIADAMMEEREVKNV